MPLNARFLILIVFVSTLLVSCATVGFARLPSIDKMFVSGASEDGFVMAGRLEYPYQPLGYLSVEATYLTPFGGLDPLFYKYAMLERVLVQNLTQKAVSKWGADGIVALKWECYPGFFTLVKVTGLAVKRK